MASDKRYWFPAKKYGWGWGLPKTWQGWVVLAVFECLLVGGILIFPPHRALTAFFIYVLAISAVFLAITWLKGEPPRWRWGDDDR